MDERERDLESLLWDVVTDREDDINAYQSSGITKLAGLLAGYERRIAELEAKLAAQEAKTG